MLTAALFAVAVMTSQDAPLMNGVIERPDWAQTPTALQLRQPEVTEWPSAGSVQLLCTMRQDGLLTSCVIEEITPDDRRVRPWALDIARYFRHQPQLRDGRPVTGLKVRFTIRWNTAE
jgi:hypothetical protein